MAVITLTTDMGLQDHYDAAVKAAILREYPEAKVVDISHEIPVFQLFQASFVLRNVYRDFPEGSVHIIGVRPEADEGEGHLIAFYKGHYFIAADNGVLSLIFDEGPERLIKVDRELSDMDRTFPTKGVFAPLACRLLKGEKLESLGTATSEFTELARFHPAVDEKRIRGTIIHVDSYANAISNISRELFERVGKNRNFAIRFRGSGSGIQRISGHYNEVEEGERVALFGSSDYLEVAINKGAPGHGEGAHKLLGLKVNDSIMVEFHDR